MNVASFFAGVGGIDLAFNNAGFKIIYANEIDKFAAMTYNNNFLDEPLQLADIQEIKYNSIPKHDVLVAGFPCQAFSVAGYRKGFEDERGNLYFRLFDIIKRKKPRVVFLENVRNLLGHDDGNTYKVIKESLESEGYNVTSKVMNACEYSNVPQNRERIYIVAFKYKKDFSKFKFPLKVDKVDQLKNYISFDTEVDKKYYYDETNFKHIELLRKEVITTETIYQWRRQYVRSNKKQMCPTLTANMGTGGHNVPIILTTDNRIRKLTPRECFNIQGFPKNYVLPDIADSKLYKQAGNSVVVPVVENIANQIYEAIT